MFKRTKISFVFLIALLTISTLLAGCGKDKADNASNSNTGKDDAVKLTMAFPGYGITDDAKLVEEAINKLTKEKINATVELVPISASAWAQQTNLMMTGDEKLDLVVTSQFFNYHTQASKGQLISLDELIDSHGQGIRDSIPERILEATKVDGKVYGVPSVRDWAADVGFIMRKDLIDKYNIDLSQVKTPADLEPILQTIKENEPDLTPITNAGDAHVAEMLYRGTYDTLGDMLGVVRFDGGQEVINMFEDEDYVNAVKTARKWFEAGYILKDSATSQESAQNYVKTGKGFGYFSQMKPGFEIQEARATGKEMVAIRYTAPYSTTDAGTGWMMSIARNSKTPEKAMEFMNLLYTDADIMNLIASGVEDKHYVVKEEGVIALPEGVTDTGYSVGQWLIGNNFLTYPWEGNDPDYWKQMEEFNESATLTPVFGFTYNPDPVKTEIAATSNVLEQFTKGLGSGTLDPEKSLPEFNKKLKAAGLDKIIAEKQKQLDEWLEAQNK